MNATFGNWVVYVRHEFYNMRYDVFMAHRQGEFLWALTPDGKTHKIDPSVEWEGPPTLSIPDRADGALQALMTAMWNAGIRPDSRCGDDQLEMRTQHLEDMRRLVFKKDYEALKPKKGV